MSGMFPAPSMQSSARTACSAVRQWGCLQRVGPGAPLEAAIGRIRYPAARRTGASNERSTAVSDGRDSPRLTWQSQPITAMASAGIDRAVTGLRRRPYACLIRGSGTPRASSRSAGGQHMCSGAASPGHSRVKGAHRCIAPGSSSSGHTESRHTGSPAACRHPARPPRACGLKNSPLSQGDATHR
jgi:hypothetical protein